MAVKTMAHSTEATKVAGLQNLMQEHVERDHTTPAEKVEKQADSILEEPIPASAFESIDAEEFYQGIGGLSLWLVPPGFVYDDIEKKWVQEIGGFGC